MEGYSSLSAGVKQRADLQQLHFWLLQDANVSLADSPRACESLSSLVKGGRNAAFVASVCTALCDLLPAETTTVLADDGAVFSRFFKRHPDRIRKWFAHFHYDGTSERGARGQRQYAFEHREVCGTSWCGPASGR